MFIVVLYSHFIPYVICSAALGHCSEAFVMSE